MVAMEVAGWLLFAAALAGVLLNFALSRRDATHRRHPATRRVVLGCMIAGGALLALIYAFATLGVVDTLMDTGRRGRSLWVPAAIFALVAVSGVRAWRRERPKS